ncbi:hypothetical protein WL61_11080 [Burkholderia ubonensis]|nr:hypothetical protein WL61_11080 [Burkholderia ubonensis]KWD26732.1 hypothetical protein WL62_09715 [Burkholderia ubonensis]
MIGVSHGQLSYDELVEVSGSYGWQPMRPALFAVLLFEFTGIRVLVGTTAMGLAKRYRECR